MMMQAVGQHLKLIFQIEDDNRKAHVKFRKENPIFYEQVWIFGFPQMFAQIPELLPRLEAIEKNVYEPCTYCKYKPGEEGGEKGGGGWQATNWQAHSWEETMM